MSIILINALTSDGTLTVITYMIGQQIWTILLIGTTCWLADMDDDMSGAHEVHFPKVEVPVAPFSCY